MFALIGGESPGRLRRTSLAASIVLAAIAGYCGGMPARCTAQPADEAAAAEESAARDLAHLAPYWDILSGEDVSAADAAVEKLSESPAETLDWIEHQFAPVLSATPEQIKDLIRQLGDDRFAIRESAQQRLSSLGWLAELPLREALAGSPPLEVRERIAYLLAEGDVTVETGMQFARSADDRRLARLAQVVRNIDSPRGGPLLRAIGPAANLTIVDARLPPLYDGLFSQSHEVQAASALAIIELGEAGELALPKLMELLTEGAGPSFSVNGGPRRTVSEHLAEALPKLGEPALEALGDVLLTHPQRVARRRAITAVSKFRDEMAIRPLLVAQSDRDHEVGSIALDGLKGFGPRAAGPIIDALKGKDTAPERPLSESNLYGVARLLPEIADFRSIEPLSQLLIHADIHVRRSAVIALRRIGADSLDVLIAASKNKHPNIQNEEGLLEHIIGGIGVLAPPEEVFDLLVDLTGRDQPVAARSAAINSISAFSPTERQYPDAINVLVQGLDDPAPSVREVSARGLWRAARYNIPLQEDRIGQPLRKLLNDEHPEVRQEAINALAAWRIPAAAEDLMPLLDKGDEQTIRLATRALGDVGNPLAIEPLRRRLAELAARGDTPDADVADVIYALGELRDLQSVEVIISLLNGGSEDVQRAAVKALGAIGDRRAAAPLIARLSGSRQTMLEAATALSVLGDPAAIEPLIAAIDQSKWGVGIPDPSKNPITPGLLSMGMLTAEPLARSLENSSSQVREVAAYVLYRLAGQSPQNAEDMQPAADLLFAALDDGSQTVRCYAAMTLALTGDRRALPTLIELIGTADQEIPHVRGAAMYIGQIGDASTIQPLAKWLKDDRPLVRTSAVRALGLLRDPQALPHVVSVRNDVDDRVRANVASGLGRIQGPEALDPLLDLARDESFIVRRAAVQALGHLGDKESTETLLEAGRDESLEIRVAAAIALVRIGNPQGVQILADCLADADQSSRRQTVTLISYTTVQDEGLAGPLIAAANDPSPRVRRDAALALGRIGAEKVVDILLDRLSDEQILAGVLQGLGRTESPRALAALIDHLDHPQPEIRIVAIAEVARFENEEHVAVLAPLLADPSREVRLAVIRAVRTLNSPRAVAPLIAALEDDDPQVRFMAAAALKRISPPP